MSDYVIRPDETNFGPKRRVPLPKVDIVAPTDQAAIEMPLWEVGCDCDNRSKVGGVSSDKAGVLRLQAGMYERRGQPTKAAVLRAQAAKLDGEAPRLSKTKARIEARTRSAEAARKPGFPGWALGAGVVALLAGGAMVASKHGGG